MSKAEKRLLEWLDLQARACKCEGGYHVTIPCPNERSPQW